MKFILCFFTFFVFLFPGLMGQQITKDQVDFLKNNIVEISERQPSTWEKAASGIEDKRIVMIGEFNHGSKEVFTIRNEFIEYLHEEQDYDVILFESGIGELIYGDLFKERLSPKQMTYGLTGPWRTKEFENLMSYIKEKNISMSGFDVQRTGGSLAYFFDRFPADSGIDSTTIQNLEQAFVRQKKLLTKYKIPLDSVELNTLQLIDAYQSVYTKLLDEKTTFNVRTDLLILKGIQNRIQYLNYMLEFKRDADWNKRWAARDSFMANNILWLSENIYPDKKIIVIAHNFHIGLYNKNEEVMGEYLKREIPDDLFVIGVYGQQGTYLNNYGKEETLSAADSTQLDIKHVINSIDLPYSFLKIPDQKESGLKWLYQPIIANDTFIDLSKSNTINLSKCFDALILIDKISPPEKD